MTEGKTKYHFKEAKASQKQEESLSDDLKIIVN